MREPDFAAYYDALGLEPGASDQDIARAKRAYNELYHADRLAHMSGAAQAIAAEKVRAANEAAHVLLDPSLRTQRDQWVRSTGMGQTSSPRAETPATHEQPVAVPTEAASARPRLDLHPAVFVLGVGLLIGAGLYLSSIQSAATPDRASQPERSTDAPPSQSAPRTSTGVAAPPKRTSGLASVVDSVISLPEDGRWTAPVMVGGPAFRGSFVPESDNVMYRVRVNGSQEFVLNSEPGFRRVPGDLRTIEFSSLTGKTVRVRYSRVRSGAPSGSTLHRRTLELAADGAWSPRVWMASVDVNWETSRPVAYEIRDDEGRIVRVPPTVQSVAFGREPVWIRFRSVDSLPLTMSVRYLTP